MRASAERARPPAVRDFNTQSAFLCQIGGTHTHARVVVSVPATLLISEFVGQVDWVKAWIVRQREHHDRGSVQDRLEQITEIDG